MPNTKYNKSFFDDWDNINLKFNNAQTNVMVYPNDVWDASNRPLIHFYCPKTRVSLGQGQPVNIFFPIPQGLDFTDGASYDDSALGFLGGSIAAAGAGARSGGAQGAIDALKNKTAAVGSIDSLLAAATREAMPEGIRSAVSVAMQTTINKNIVTEFTGVGTRAYTFKFKMIAINKSESDIIKNICHTFRLGMYPEGDAIALKYPPTWEIRFIKKNGLQIEYIPKIFECYLTNVNTAYNSSGNLWHTDGSPLECDLTIAFKETRTLTAKDIAILDQGGFDPLKLPQKITIPPDLPPDISSQPRLPSSGGNTQQAQLA